MSLTEWQITSEHFKTMVDRLEKRGVGEFKLTNKQLSSILNNCLK